MRTLKFHLVPIFLIITSLNFAQAQEEYCYFQASSTAPGYNQTLMFWHFSPIIKYDPSEISTTDLARSWYDFLQGYNSKQSFPSYNSYNPAKICRSDKSGLMQYKNKEYQKLKAFDSQYSHHKTFDYTRYISSLRGWEYYHLIDQ